MPASSRLTDIISEETKLDMIHTWDFDQIEQDLRDSAEIGQLKSESIHDKHNNVFYEGTIMVPGRQRHGFGVFISKDGDRYEGWYSEGRRHGFGAFRGSDGSIYKGKFLNDIPDDAGKAEYVYPNNVRYVGPFRGGKQHGQGELIRPDGAQMSCNFVKGKPDGPCFIQFDFPDARSAFESYFKGNRAGLSLPPIELPRMGSNDRVLSGQEGAAFMALAPLPRPPNTRNLMASNQLAQISDGNDVLAPVHDPFAAGPSNAIPPMQYPRLPLLTPTDAETQYGEPPSPVKNTDAGQPSDEEPIYDGTNEDDAPHGGSENGGDQELSEEEESELLDDADLKDEPPHLDGVYVCSTCGDTRITNDKIYAHIWNAHRPADSHKHMKQYSICCPICGKSLNGGVGSWTYHMRSQHPEINLKEIAKPTPFRCRFGDCSEGFQCKHIAIRHLLRKHLNLKHKMRRS